MRKRQKLTPVPLMITEHIQIEIAWLEKRLSVSGKWAIRLSELHQELLNRNSQPMEAK